nr:unnamed protein product [Spirometra erinaceieuropaei]
MVKSCRKNKSKRITCHKRYKIIKKVREHHRKVRREQRNNPQKFRRKDPGIPNSLPFKEEILKHVIETKEREAQRRIDVDSLLEVDEGYVDRVPVVESSGPALERLQQVCRAGSSFPEPMLAVR